MSISITTTAPSDRYFLPSMMLRPRPSNIRPVRPRRESRAEVETAGGTDILPRAEVKNPLVKRLSWSMLKLSSPSMPAVIMWLAGCSSRAIEEARVLVTPCPEK
jgi:hypothetical protein